MRKPKEYAAFEDLLKRVLAWPKVEIDRRAAEFKKASTKTRSKLEKKPPNSP